MLTSNVWRDNLDAIFAPQRVVIASDFTPWSTFTRIVARYHGDHSVQTFPCTERYRAMAFAQLTYRESLRDIEACLSAQPAKLWHMGFGRPV